MGRAFKNIVFTVKSQAVALPLAFGVLSDEAPGQSEQLAEKARLLLDRLNIKTPALVDQILASSEHVSVCIKFAYDLKTNKHDKVHSHSGLLLTMLGLKKASGKASNGPLFDKPAKTR